MNLDNAFEISKLLKRIVEGRYEKVDPAIARSEAEERLLTAINDLVAQKEETLSTFNRELLLSESRLRGIIESTPVGICITNEDHNYEYVNPTYCKLYGYEPEELVGRPFTMVVPDPDKDRLGHLHNEFMGRRYELRGEWKVQKKNGELMTIIADAAYIIDVDEKPKKVTFVIDITDRKRAETLLKETVDRLNSEIEERKRIEKLKSEVERVIRHDLRNPVGGIISAAQLLKQETVSPDAQELIDIIYESGRKLDKMLSSSLDFIRMEEGTYELTPRRTDLAEVLKDVEQEMRQSLEARDVGLEYDRAASWPIEGERYYLEELFANLVRNAIEASGAGDRVTIAVEEATGAEIGDLYRIDIHNSGVVPEEIRDIFFERYATSGKRGGNGLGTHIARLVTSVHGGAIRYTTDEDEGTHLIVELPKRQGE